MDDISVHAFKTFAFSVENRHRGPRRVCGPLLGWKTSLHNGRQEFLAANKLHRSINDTVELEMPPDPAHHLGPVSSNAEIRRNRHCPSQAGVVAAQGITRWRTLRMRAWSPAVQEQQREAFPGPVARRLNAVTDHVRNWLFLAKENATAKAEKKPRKTKTRARKMAYRQIAYPVTNGHEWRERGGTLERLPTDTVDS